MDRRKFIQKLGAGAVVASTVPIAAKAIKEGVGEATPRKLLMVDISEIPPDMTLQEIIDEWHRTGTIIYQPKPAKYKVYGYDFEFWVDKETFDRFVINDTYDAMNGHRYLVVEKGLNYIKFEKI